MSKPLESMPASVQEGIMPYPKPEQTLPSVEKQIYPRWRGAIGKRVAGGVLALAAATGAGSEYYTDSPVSVANYAYDYAAGYGDTVSPDTLALVDKLADRPADPESKALLNTPYDLESREAAENWGRQWELLSIKKAAEHGLTIIDPEPYREKIANAGNPKEVESIVHQYTQQLGSGFVIPEKHDLRDLGLPSRLVDQSTINLEQFKRGTSNLLGILALMPKELHELTGMREMRIVDRIGAVENDLVGSFEPAGVANSFSGIIYIPLEQVYESRFSLFMHEGSHQMDFRLNGGRLGMYRDVPYKALNPQGFEYGNPNTPHLDSAVPERYSATNVAEDKANLLEAMINGLSTEFLYKAPEPIRKKYRYLLARLEESVPGIAAYLMALGGGTDLFPPEAER